MQPTQSSSSTIRPRLDRSQSINRLALIPEKSVSPTVEMRRTRSGPQHRRTSAIYREQPTTRIAESLIPLDQNRWGSASVFDVPPTIPKRSLKKIKRSPQKPKRAVSEDPETESAIEKRKPDHKKQNVSSPSAELKMTTRTKIVGDSKKKWGAAKLIRWTKKVTRARGA